MMHQIQKLVLQTSNENRAPQDLIEVKLQLISNCHIKYNLRDNSHLAGNKHITNTISSEQKKRFSVKVLVNLNKSEGTCKFFHIY